LFGVCPTVQYRPTYLPCIFSAKLVYLTNRFTSKCYFSGEKTVAADVLKMIQDHEVKFIDLRFTDTNGKEHHVTVPAHVLDADKFEDGHPFDGSSIAGWKNIHASDMLLIPDPETASLDPFME